MSVSAIMVVWATCVVINFAVVMRYVYRETRSWDEAFGWAAWLGPILAYGPPTTIAIVVCWIKHVWSRNA